MSEEKPLHVRVAEALGCTPEFRWDMWRCPCPPPEHLAVHSLREIPPANPRHIALFSAHRHEVAPYDRSWYATGPWIERYGLTVENVRGTLAAVGASADWRASVGWGGDLSVYGATPLIAVCNLILALHELGKLERIA